MSEHLTGEQLADAVREAHRDNDTYDVDHYCTRLTNRIAELEQQLADKDKCIDRLKAVLEHALVGCKIATLLPCDNPWTDEYVQEIESFLEGKTKNRNHERTGR